jgi:hypothetical protein
MTDPNPHADLVNALGALTNIQKTGDVQAGQRRYRYVELDELLDAARPILAAHRLALTQDIATDDLGHLAVTTILWHASGEKFTFGPLRSHQPDAPQALGSIITYWRRYSAMAALGVAGQDDDAQQAQQHTQTARRTPQQDREAYGQTRAVQRQQAAPDDPANQLWTVTPITPHEQPEHADGPASEGQVKYMFDLMKKAGIPRDMYKRWLAGVVSWDGPVEDFTSKTLTKHQVSGIITRLQKLVPPPEEGQ